LKTNLGLLNNGVTWGYTILICVVAFFSKFLGCAITAKISGFTYRESGAIGSLMSCKGYAVCMVCWNTAYAFFNSLVELIVLNVGLSAGILDTRTFSMFVLHALVLTFITTPLTLIFYPAKYRTRASATPRKPAVMQGKAEKADVDYFGEAIKTNFTVIVDRIEQLPTLMTLTQLLQSSAPSSPVASPPSDTSSSHEKEKDISTIPAVLSYSAPSHSQVSIDVLRLIELTDRTSAVLKSQSLNMLAQTDSILSIFRTFAFLNRIAVSESLKVIAFEEFAPSIAKFARDAASQMVILPWNSGIPLGDDSTIEGAAGPTSSLLNPFDTLFGQSQARGGSQNISVVQTQFFRKMFAAATTDVALYMDRGLSQPVDGQASLHIFLPFFGGPDDRLALSFITQLCMNPFITATVVRFVKAASDDLTPVSTIEEAKLQAQIVQSVGYQHDFTYIHLLTTRPQPTFPDTVYPSNTQTRLASETADNLWWDRYATSAIPELADAFRRMSFAEQSSALPLHSVLNVANETASARPQSRLLVVAGRSRRLAVESHAVELQQLLVERNASLGSETIKTVGDVGSAFVATKTNASLLVLQAFLS
jgi:hypothetical protein